MCPALLMLNMIATDCPRQKSGRGLKLARADDTSSERCCMVCRISGASDIVGPVTDSLEPLRKAFKVGTAHATLYGDGSQCHEPELGGRCHVSAAHATMAASQHAPYRSKEPCHQ